MKKDILIIYSASNNSVYLDPLRTTQDYQLHFEHYDLAQIERLAYSHPDDVTPFNYVEYLDKVTQDASSVDALITSQDYPACLIASLVAQKTGHRFASPKSILSCQHKYYFRKRTQEIVPEATPSFTLIDQNNLDSDYDFPLFVKPIKATFSLHAQKISNKEELEKHCAQTAYNKNYLSFFNDIFKRYTTLSYDANFLIGETLLEGNQVSLEGYIYNGQVQILGIFDAHFYSETLCFSEFSYPSTLPKTVQKRMYNLTEKVITGLELDNTFFSIEYIYDPQNDSLFIIEVNPRISPQFADIFHKVMGVNSYVLLVNIALDRKPSLSNGEFACAASFPERLFKDKKVVQIPTKEDLNKITTIFPDAVINIIAQEGKLLSERRQSGNSYLYVIINIGAQNFDELKKKRDTILALLPFVFEPVH